MIKPLGERVLVEAIEQETTTSFGIVLPASAKEKPPEGEYEGKEYLIMKESDIHAIIG